MKKTTKVILGSVLTMALSASLIAGSTFALFTSETSTNIAITSGKVEVAASVDNLVGHSLDKAEILASEGAFTNGGTFSYDDKGTLTLDKISAGDGVKFNLVITNSSTISIKYQVRLQASNTDFSGENGLAVTVNEKKVPANGTTYATDWSEVIPATSGEEVITEIPVTVELPEAAGNEYMEKTCELKIAVLAYQGNAKTENPDPSAKISLYNLADFKMLASMVENDEIGAEDEVKLMANVDFNAPATIAARVSYVYADTLGTAAEDWTPIGSKEHPFRGKFIGNGHTIANFTATATSDAQAAGFFGYVDGATISDVHFTGANVTASGEGNVAGVVVGQATGNVTFEKVTVEGTCTAEENATVGGLVGKLEGTAEQTTLNVTGSSFEGEGTTEFVGDKGEATVDVASSSITDTTTDETVNWNENGEATYNVSSAEEITELLADAQADEKLCVVLESDLDLTESSLTVDKNLTIDVGGNNLTVKSQGTNAGIAVSAGKNLTIKGAESGTVKLGNESDKRKPAISVNGTGANLNFENVKVQVNNAYTCNSAGTTNNIAPAILAENGGTVNIGSNSEISVTGKSDTHPYAYKEPQIAAATGKNSTINVDGDNIVLNLTNATGLYAEKGGTINFKNGTVNMTSGGSCVGLGLGDGAGKIVFSGGTINIKGDLSGKHSSDALKDFAIAIGSSAQATDDGLIIANGGTINLQNTSGTAIAFGAIGDDLEFYVGDGVTINLQAKESGTAYVGASDYVKCTRVYIYNDATITGVDDIQNFKCPELDFYGGIGGGYYNGDLVSIYDEDYFRGPKNLSDDYPEYTKAGMELI